MRPTALRMFARKALGALLVSALVELLVGASAHAGAWFKVESEHFIVNTDGPESKARDYVRQLEAFRYIGLLLLNADNAGARAQAKFEIYLLKDQDAMQTVRPAFSNRVAGVYFQCRDGASAYSTLQTHWGMADEDPGLAVLFHEYAHHLMFQYAKSGYPTWYVEGFAEYLSTASVEPGKVSIGNPSRGRLSTLRQDRWIDFKRVLKPGFQSTGDKANDAWEVESFYAQSWLLAHYMLSDSERTKRFNAYFERIGAGEDPVDAFEPATGIALGSLRRTLSRYLDNLAVIGVKSADIPNAAVKTEALPDSANDYVLIASLLKTCPAKAQGEAILAQLRALKGTAASLRLARDRAEILFGDLKTASDDLSAYVSTDEASFEVHYLLGRALMKRATTLEGEAQSGLMRQARGEFLKAYRLKKLDAPNLFLLGQSLAGDGVDTNVLNAVRGARALAPSVAEYAAYEAFLDLDVDDRERAVRALTPLASDPHDQRQAARARKAIEAIKAGKSRADVSAALKDEDEAPAGR